MLMFYPLAFTDDERQIGRRFSDTSVQSDRNRGIPKIVVNNKGRKEHFTAEEMSMVKNNGKEKNITITINRGRDSGKEIMMMVQEADNALGNQTCNTKITINYKIQVL